MAIEERADDIRPLASEFGPLGLQRQRERGAGHRIRGYLRLHDHRPQHIDREADGQDLIVLSGGAFYARAAAYAVAPSNYYSWGVVKLSTWSPWASPSDRSVLCHEFDHLMDRPTRPRGGTVIEEQRAVSESGLPVARTARGLKDPVVHRPMPSR